jgi:ribosomal protein L23
MKTSADFLVQPLISEKASKKEAKLNEYAVVVDAKLTKPEIAAAVAKIFGVQPIKVRTVVFRKKTKQTRFGVVPAKSFKKALIRLPQGKRLEIK